MPTTVARPSSPDSSHIEPDGHPDWPVQATDAIVRTVDTVRDKTTGPALNASRYVVYGLVWLLLAVPVAVLALIGIFRLVEGFLLWVNETYSWAEFLHDPIGFVYLTFGLLFSLTGLILWRRSMRAVPS